jgi:ferrochelatase
MTPSEPPPETSPALVLLNFGGPRNLEEVFDFLYEILRDPNTIQLPFPRLLQDLLARRIALRRSPEVRRQYGEIGGKSPIVAATERVAAALRQTLKKAGHPVSVFVGHRYLPGWTDIMAEEIVAAGVTRLLAVPFYPHFSYATTGSSIEQLRQALTRAGYEGEVQAVRSFPDHPGYLEALSARLEECLARAAPLPAETVVLCSAHGLPVAYVKRGDPYKRELERTVAALRERFPQWRFELAFQSRLGPVEWLKPYTDEIVPEFAREGVKHVVFLPISFLNDHIETLYEIGHTYFALARDHGVTPHLVQAIEHHPLFVDTLAGFVADWRAGRGGVPAEVLLPPDQSFARIGRWAWALWLAALATALWFALT